MRPSNKSRSRNKSGSNSGHNSSRRNIGNVMNRVFDSAGPDGKVRGTPQQIIDKYQALARDAQLSGDRVAAESFLQHSEHYSRLLGEAQRQQQEQRQNQQEREAAPQQPERNQAPDEPQPRPREQENQTSNASESSGLTTIDTEDSESESGPIETPEGGGKRGGARRTARKSEEAVREERVNGAPSPAGEASESAPAAKRPRTRRKAKADTPAETTEQAQSD